MAKRTKHSKKKREPAWMLAARDKLRGRARSDDELIPAFLKMAFPGHDAVGLSKKSVQEQLDRAQFAWNLPLLHALPTDSRSVSTLARLHADTWFPRLPDFLGELGPMFAMRCGDFQHLGTPVVRASVGESDGDETIDIALGQEVVPASSMLDIGSNGWPKASHSLLVFSGPLRDLLPTDYSQAEAEDAIDLATAAWNLFSLRSFDTGPLRREAIDVAERASKRPEAIREAFQGMIHARQTRFAYDPRAVTGVSVRLNERMIHLNVATVHAAKSAVGAGDDQVPVAQLQDESWLEAVRRRLRNVVLT